MARKKATEKKEEKTVKKAKEEKTVEKETSDKVESCVFGVWEVVVIALIAVVFGLLLGSFLVYNKYNNDKGKRKDNIDEIRRVYNSLLDDYYNNVSEEELVNGAIMGMIGSLDDPYALFLSKEDAQDFDEELKGYYNGLGVTIQITYNGQIIVVEVREGSPADKASIKVGDIITKMDSKAYNADNYLDMIYIIKNSKIGEKREFELLRGNDIVNAVVTIDKVELDSVTSIIYDGADKKVGIIGINNFAANTYSQFLKIYKELEEAGVDSLVIDLRFNMGGYISSARDIASLFIEKGSVVYKTSDGKNIETIVSEKDKVIDMPVVLIINQYTASSAEIFAACLADNIGVDVVGVTSYGKGTVQKLMELSDGTYVKYTVYEWLTPKGEKINEVGVVPNYVVDLTEGKNTDDQLDKAVSIAINK